MTMIIKTSPKNLRLNPHHNIEDKDKRVVFDGSFEGGNDYTQHAINKFLEYHNIKDAIYLTMNEKVSLTENYIHYKNYCWTLYKEKNYPRIDLTNRPFLFTYLGGYARPDKCLVFNRLFEQEMLQEAIWSFSGATADATSIHFVDGSLDILPKYLDINLKYKISKVLEEKVAWEKTFKEINLDFYKSRFSLVQETEMCSDSNRYTEKTYKCLTIGHPFIIAGNYQVLRLLRKDGFKTFSPYINEDYDDIEDKNDRVNALITETKRLCSMSESEWSDLLINIEPILKHNYQNAKQL